MPAPAAAASCRDSDATCADSAAVASRDLHAGSATDQAQGAKVHACMQYSSAGVAQQSTKKAAEMHGMSHS